MTETRDEPDNEPAIEEPRDCCAPGRAAFLQPAPGRTADV